MELCGTGQPEKGVPTIMWSQMSQWMLVRHKISQDHRGFHLAHFGTVSDLIGDFPPAEPLWLELKLWDSWTSTSADGTRNTPNSAEM